MKKEKGILKKKGQGFKIGFVATLSSIVILTGGAAVYGNVSLADYSNNKQINSIAQELDCDTSYLTEVHDKYVRMEHNGKEPIYVCFDGQLSEVEKASAINSLDYVFGIVGKINDKYRYKVIDKSKYDKSAFKTKIYFDKNDDGGASGDIADIDIDLNVFSYFTSKRTMYNFEIHQKSSAKTNEELEFMYTHELWHAFGISDVYYNENTTKHQGNTVIKPELGRKVGIITPNDFKCLISLYAEKFDSQSEQNVAVENFKSMIEEYEEYYYDYFASRVVEYKGIQESISTNAFYWQGYSQFTVNNSQSVGYFYKIQVNDGQYIFKILDTSNNLLDSYTGKAHDKNGIIVLQDVELKEGLLPGLKGNPNGYIQDFALVQQNGVVKLIDPQSDIYISGFKSSLETSPDYDKSID